MLAEDSIGYFYAKGMEVQRDDAEAVAWFRKAAEQDMAGAQYNLGIMYERGLAYQDRSQALEWYRRSANQGYEKAKKALLGFAIEDGTDSKVAQDFRSKWRNSSSDAVASSADVSRRALFLDGSH